VNRGRKFSCERFSVMEPAGMCGWHDE
jgi:hypothetical protein